MKKQKRNHFCLQSLIHEVTTVIPRNLSKWSEDFFNSGRIKCWNLLPDHQGEIDSICFFIQYHLDPSTPQHHPSPFLLNYLCMCGKIEQRKNLQQSINYSFLENLVWPNFLLCLKCIYLAASCVCVFDNLSIVNKVINLSLCGGPMRGEYSCVYRPVGAV